MQEMKLCFKFFYENLILRYHRPRLKSVMIFWNWMASLSWCLDASSACSHYVFTGGKLKT